MNSSLYDSSVLAKNKCILLPFLPLDQMATSLSSFSHEGNHPLDISKAKGTSDAKPLSITPTFITVQSQLTNSASRSDPVGKLNLASDRLVFSGLKLIPPLMFYSSWLGGKNWSSSSNPPSGSLCSSINSQRRIKFHLFALKVDVNTA